MSVLALKMGLVKYSAVLFPGLLGALNYGHCTFLILGLFWIHGWK